MLKRITALDYDYTKVALFVHTTDVLSDKKVDEWLNQNDFASRKIFTSTDSVTEPMARKAALQFMMDENCEYIFMVDGYVQLTNEMVLKRLIESNKDIVAPAMSRFGKLWSNFWGAIASGKFNLNSRLLYLSL